MKKQRLRHLHRLRDISRRSLLHGESLEPRLALTAITMSANDQLLLELINRARANPMAEVARVDGISDLNAGLSAGTISSDPKQPLAPHQALVAAATDHSVDMLSRDFFSHTNPEGQTPSDRAREAGYPTGVAENIAWGGSSAPVDQIDQVFARHESLFLSPGHRRNLLSASHDESGVAIRYGMFTSAPGQSWYAGMVTEKFGNRGGNAFITGVAYDDAVVNDDFYTVGEAAQGVLITAVRDSDQVTITTTSGPSGGYSLQVPTGTYTVTASGGGIATQIVESNVQISGANRKVDFIVTESTPPDPVDPNGVAIIGRQDGNLWQAESTGSSLVSSLWTTWSDNVTWQDVQTGDVDGDGHDDIVGRANGQWWVTRETPDGIVHEQWTTWTTKAHWHDVQVADVDGDGRDDIVGRVADRVWWVARSQGDSFVNQRWGSWSNRIAWKDVSVGDFNGDGRDDIVGRTDRGAWWVARSTGSEFINEHWGNWSNRRSWSDMLVGDLNGDGRDDLAGRAGGIWFVSRSNGSRFVNEAWGRWSTRATWSDVAVADVDGNGRDDIVGRANNGAWWVARSTGSSLRNQRWDTWSRTANWLDVQVVDLNLDGRDDLVGRAGANLWAALSSGSDFSSRVWGEWPQGAPWQDVLAGKFS